MARASELLSADTQLVAPQPRWSRKMVEHPFFLEKGYGDYPPLNVRRILASLNVADESIPSWAMQYIRASRFTTSGIGLPTRICARKLLNRIQDWLRMTTCVRFRVARSS